MQTEPEPLNILKKAVLDFRLALIAMAIFSLFANLLLLTIPLYMLQIYDRVLPSQSSNTLFFLSVLAMFALIVLGLTEMVRQILANRMAARLDTALSNELLQKVIRLAQTSNIGIQPMRNLQLVRTLLSSRVIFAIIDLPFAVVFIGLLYFIHPDLFWLTLTGAVILTIMAIFNQYFSQKPLESQAQAVGTSSRQAEHYARNSDSIVAMGMVKDVISNWGRENANALVSADKASSVNAVFSGISRIFRLGIQLAILGYGALLVVGGEMTAGMIFASSIIAGRGLQPIDQVINSWRQLNEGRKAWVFLKKFIGNTTDRDSYTELPAPKGNLELKDVLQINPIDRTKPPLVNRISFSLQAGESVAVVGPSGSGKSTLARMIVGALQPAAGHVRLDGNDISNWDPEDLGKHVGYLAQDVELLPGTVAQNIARFDPHASDQKVLAAANLAHVEDMIKHMPFGYDTVIGPGGLQVSGGEKQRIALARAFYGSPKLLVLDEPNSSLDRIGENALLRALVEAKKQGITVFLITQRELVLKVVDKIMRIQDGQIIEFGPVKEIMKKHADLAKKAAKTKNGNMELSTQIKMKGSGSVMRGKHD